MPYLRCCLKLSICCVISGHAALPEYTGMITITPILEGGSECRKTKTKPITNQLDHPANLKLWLNQNKVIITFGTQLKTSP